MLPARMRGARSMRSPASRSSGGMEAALQRELGTARLRPTGHSGGGCISQGQSYDTDRGRVFVKSNSKAEVGGAGLGLQALPRRARCGWRGKRPGRAMRWRGRTRALRCGGINGSVGRAGGCTPSDRCRYEPALADCSRSRPDIPWAGR